MPLARGRSATPSPGATLCVCSSVSLLMFTLARPHVKPLSAVKITATGATPGEGCFKDWERWTGSCMAKEFFLGCEMRLIVLCLFAALTARAQTTAERLPVTDPEKIADALSGIL